MWAAKAEQTEKVGWAEAEVIEKKTKAMWQSNFANVEQIRALAENNISIVPKILVNGWENWNSGGLIDWLLAASALKRDLLDDKEESIKSKKTEKKEEPKVEDKVIPLKSDLKSEKPVIQEKKHEPEKKENNKSKGQKDK